jgi:predicted nucleic acid-binding protein
LRWLGEGPNHLAALKEQVIAGKIAGGMIHDARIAALCRAHGVKELWSADRDFSRMKGLKTRNPLTA